MSCFLERLPRGIARVLGALALGIALLGRHSAQAETSPTDTVLANTRFSAATLDASGVRSHRVECPLQAGPTELRVVLSPGVDASARAPVVYLLPVEANREARYGDPIRELLDKRLHERFRAIYVAPTFAHLPWYANHPTRQDLQQERYFVELVAPFIERTYPVAAGRSGRLLLGFSKSGWGAWTLLLRHPDTFERAGAFDAPMMLDRPGKYGSGEIFGDAANFAQYHVNSLVADRRESLVGPAAPRLILIGRGNFDGEHAQIKQRFADLQIPLATHDPSQRKHDWHSGWVEEILERLLAPKSNTP